MSSKRRHTNKTHAAMPSEAFDPQEAYDAMPHDASTPSPEPRPIARQAAFEGDRIGDILRRVREHRGEHLEDISEYLRIRPNYLFALENNRYEDLPADAYVIGFLRTYAAYLGLDGKGAIDQYRREMMGRRRKPQLSMPQPMPEGRAPAILLLAAAAVAAVILYGLWYGLSSPDPAPQEPAAEVSLATPGATPTPAQAATPAPTETLTTQTATSDGIALPVPASATEQQQSATPSSAAVTSKTEATPAVPPAPAKTEPVVTTPPATPAAPATPTEAKPTPPAPGASYGAKGKTRLAITAEKESWIMVTDAKGNTVFDRTLKPGETYNVPTGKGLKITTGNAKGLNFNLDGAVLPKMQNDSPVIRAMPLDPDKIKGQLNGSIPLDEEDTEE